MKTILSPRHLQRLTLSLLLLCLPFNGYAQSALNGDVNGDGNVNITDVNAIISIILDGKTTTPAAAVNSDGTVNITDINAIINVILGGTDNHEYVDLGLPSGTLWATCNVGASAPEESGDYFAWGETEPKDYYDWNSYKWCNGSNMTLTKYCTDSSYGYNGFFDIRAELDLEDDAAYVNWGSSWRMPTLDQQIELIDNCTWTWTTQNGVNGHLFTGPNGNTLFLPAAGQRSGSSLINAGTLGCCWSRTLNSSDTEYAHSLFFNSGRMDWGSSSRIYGIPVRAVRVSQN